MKKEGEGTDTVLDVQVITLILGGLKFIQQVVQVFVGQLVILAIRYIGGLNATENIGRERRSSG